MSLGERVAKKRQEMGMKVRELAERLRIKPAIVSMLESGEETPEDLGEGISRLFSGWLEAGQGPRKKLGPTATKARNTLPGRE